MSCFPGCQGITATRDGRVPPPFPDYDPATKTLGSSPRRSWNSNGHPRWRPLRAEVGRALWSAATCKPVGAPRSSYLACCPGCPARSPRLPKCWLASSRSAVTSHFLGVTSRSQQKERRQDVRYHTRWKADGLENLISATVQEAGLLRRGLSPRLATRAWVARPSPYINAWNTRFSVHTLIFQHSATMGVASIFKTIFLPTTKKAQDGRDQWPSRTSFILAAMGGCVGLGNILRYRWSTAPGLVAPR